MNGGAPPAWARVLRALVVTAALGAALMGAALARRARIPTSDATFSCPMHAQVIASADGACPICGMALARDAGGLRATMAVVSSDGQSLTWRRPDLHVMSHGTWRADLPAQDVEAPAMTDGGGEVVAVMYRDEREALAPGAPIAFVLDGEGPERAWPVRLVGERPRSTRAAAGTTRVLFRASSADSPPARAVGRVRGALAARTALLAPPGAVLESPDGPYVLVEVEEGRRFAVRHVELGRASLVSVVVLGGLRFAERMVSMSPFLLDAERRAGAASPGPGGAP